MMAPERYDPRSDREALLVEVIMRRRQRNLDRGVSSDTRATFEDGDGELTLTERVRQAMRCRTNVAKMQETQAGIAGQTKRHNKDGPKTLHFTNLR